MEMTSMLWSMPWFGWVAIVAILSGTVSSLFKMWIEHRERIEMIRHGMHPDAAGGKPAPIREL